MATYSNMLPWKIPESCKQSDTTEHAIVAIIMAPRQCSSDTKLNSNKQTSHSPVQFSSVAQSCPTLCNPMNSTMPGLPVHHQLLESTQTHVH